MSYRPCGVEETPMRISATMITALLIGLGLAASHASASSKPAQQAAATPGPTTGQEPPVTPPPSSPNPDASGIFHVGKGVSPPRVIYSVDPQFTEKARQKKLSGTCVVSMVVDRTGTPQDVQISKSIESAVAPKLRSSARGLDENCVEAAKQYRFKPGAYKGKPIPVEIKVEINYRIY